MHDHRSSHAVVDLFFKGLDQRSGSKALISRLFTRCHFISGAENSLISIDWVCSLMKNGQVKGLFSFLVSLSRWPSRVEESVWVEEVFYIPMKALNLVREPERQEKTSIHCSGADRKGIKKGNVHMLSPPQQLQLLIAKHLLSR